MGALADHAAALFAAERDATPIAPLTETDPDLNVEDAYAIQHMNIERRVVDGEVVRGRKIGLTSRAMQEMLGVSEPDFGVLLDTMIVDPGDPVPCKGLIAPRVESEIAFVMAEDLVGPGVNTVMALRAVAGVLPAIEVIDSRIAEWKIKLVDTIADNASSARVILGSRLTPVTDDLDLRLIGAAFAQNGTVVETGAGAAVLGHPARCLAWLANKLAEFDEHIHAGEIVIPGSLHRAITVNPGDVVTAEFDRLGTVSVRFDP